MILKTLFGIFLVLGFAQCGGSASDSSISTTPLTTEDSTEGDAQGTIATNPISKITITGQLSGAGLQDKEAELILTDIDGTELSYPIVIEEIFEVTAETNNAVEVSVKTDSKGIIPLRYNNVNHILGSHYVALIPGSEVDFGKINYTKTAFMPEKDVASTMGLDFKQIDQNFNAHLDAFEGFEDLTDSLCEASFASPMIVPVKNGHGILKITLNQPVSDTVDTSLIQILDEDGNVVIDGMQRNTSSTIPPYVLAMTNPAGTELPVNTNLQLKATANTLFCEDTITGDTTTVEEEIIVKFFTLPAKN